MAKIFKIVFQMFLAKYLQCYLDFNEELDGLVNQEFLKLVEELSNHY